MQTATQNTKRTRKTPIPATSMLADISTVKMVPLDLIDTLPQIRKTFDQDSIEELAKDIQQRSLLQPILLNPVNDRYQLIAGERRLKAVTHNGATGIPALLVKASTNDAILMQLAENIQRENLSLVEEVEAIRILYETLGSLAEVSKAIKKSVPWCSKRYAMAENKLTYQANKLLSDGITEDLELLNAFSKLCDYINWNEITDWTAKIRNGQAGRNEIRNELKTEKARVADEEAEENAEKKNNEKKISHAKKEPTAPPEWNLKEALQDLNEALFDPEAEKEGIELYRSWTPEQQDKINTNLSECSLKGDQIGLRGIRELGRSNFYSSLSLTTLATIYGYAHKSWNLMHFMEELQIPRENA